MFFLLLAGDVIGARRMDTHFEGAVALGAKLDFKGDITASVDKIVGTEILLDEPSIATRKPATNVCFV